MTEIKVYTLAEIEGILKVTRRTLLNYIKSGKLKGKKVGGKWLISDANLREFVGA